MRRRKPAGKGSRAAWTAAAVVALLTAAGLWLAPPSSVTEFARAPGPGGGLAAGPPRNPFAEGAAAAPAGARGPAAPASAWVSPASLSPTGSGSVSLAASGSAGSASPGSVSLADAGAAEPGAALPVRLGAEPDRRAAAQDSAPWHAQAQQVPRAERGASGGPAPGVRLLPHARRRAQAVGPPAFVGHEPPRRAALPGSFAGAGRAKAEPGAAPAAGAAAALGALPGSRAASGGSGAARAKGPARAGPSLSATFARAPAPGDKPPRERSIGGKPPSDRGERKRYLTTKMAPVPAIQGSRPAGREEERPCAQSTVKVYSFPDDEGRRCVTQRYRCRESDKPNYERGAAPCAVDACAGFWCQRTSCRPCAKDDCSDCR